MPSRSLYRERELRPQRNLGQAPLIWRLQYYWPSQPRQYERPFFKKKITQLPRAQRDRGKAQRGREDGGGIIGKTVLMFVSTASSLSLYFAFRPRTTSPPSDLRHRGGDGIAIMFSFFWSFGFEIYISIKRVFISLLGPLNPLKARCVCFPNVNQGKRSILLSTWRRSVSFFYFVLQRCGHMKQKCFYGSPELGSSRSQESGGVFRVGPRTDPPLPG